MDDGHGGLLPGVDDAITRTVTGAVWLGITTGYLTLTGSCRIPASACAASPDQDVLRSAPGDGVRLPASRIASSTNRTHILVL